MTGEEGAFNWLGSIVSWFNMSINANVVAIDELNYVTNKFSLEPDKTLLLYIRTLYGENKSEALIYYYPNGIDWSTIEPTKRNKVIKIGEEESEEKSEET